MSTSDTLNTLDIEERLHRIHVLSLDAQEAFKENDAWSFTYIIDELIHYTHSNTTYPNSGRWD